MAEEEFGLDDELDEELDDLPEGEETAAEESFFKRKRLLIIGGVVAAVLLLATVLFGIRFFSDSEDTPKRSVSNSVDSNLSQVQKNETQEKKKKKKKKIKYERMFSQLSGEQTSQILKEFSFAGIAFSTEQSGKNFSVSVDEDRIDEARNLLAVKGLPATGVRGYALLDNAQTLGVTEFDKRIRFLRALSGELENAIMQFDIVEDAKVQIVLPEQRLFSVAQPPVTSSILVRKRPGSTLSDDIVFGIIQLVSNAVENLQQENVSVIDTDGIVLSEGIFERLAARKAATEEPRKLHEIEPIKPKPAETSGEQVSEPGVPKPIVPNFGQINKWFDIKAKYEEELTKKATKQLMGVLPVGAFKVAVTSEIGPLEDGEIVDIQRLTFSVVVDNLNEEIFLDAATKREIFNTVAGATGYIRGRDRILLSRADFTLLTPEERAEMERLQKEDPNVMTYVFIALAVLGLGGAGFGAYRFYRSRKEKALEETPTPEFSGIAPSVSDAQQVERIKSNAATNPKAIAKIMEKWLENTEKQEDAIQDVFDEDVSNEEEVLT